MVAKREIEIGARYGKLVVLGEAERTTYLKLACDCGKTFEAAKGAVRSGNTKSCGCARVETLVSMLTTHGMRQHPLYSTWADMRKRCLNPRCESYKHYGGRGITICHRWDSFENFVADMVAKPFAGASLDRKDTNGNYEPSNCKWSTPTEQVINQRCSLRYVYKEQQYTLRELAVVAESFGVSYGTLKARISKGMAVELAVEKPKQALGRHKVPTDTRSLTNRVGVVKVYE